MHIQLYLHRTGKKTKSPKPEVFRPQPKPRQIFSEKKPAKWSSRMINSEELVRTRKLSKE